MARIFGTRDMGRNMTELTMKQAMAMTAQAAKEDNHLYFLFKSKSQGWLCSAHYAEDWLFKAYPGGRKLLSFAGAKLMQELGESL